MSRDESLGTVRLAQVADATSPENAARGTVPAPSAAKA